MTESASSYDILVTGPRIAAQLADTVVISVLYILVSMAGTALVGGAYAFNFRFTGFEALYALGGYLLGLVLVFFLYFIILEGRSGQTVGKRLMSIKVVREDGSSCGYGPATVRNLARIIDVLPFLYLLGFIVIIRSDKRQRLGDIIAKTIVVRSRIREN